jgi:hypothetical protein
MLLFFAAWIAKEQKKTIDSFKGIVVKSDSATVIAQKQRIVSLEDAVKLGLIEKARLLDKINSQTHVKGETIIVEKEIPVKVPVYVYVDSSTGEKFNCVKLPVPIRYEDSFNLFCGELDSAKFTLDTLLVKNSFSVTIGEQKTKWWKSPEPMVEIASNNPNTKIEVSSIQIKQSKPFYKTVWFGGVVGFLVAAILLI